MAKIVDKPETGSVTDDSLKAAGEVTTKEALSYLEGLKTDRRITDALENIPSLVVSIGKTDPTDLIDDKLKDYAIYKLTEL